MILQTRIIFLVSKNLRWYLVLLISGYASAQKQQEGIKDYAKLVLNWRELKGSRWQVEQQEKKQVITVYHAFEIVDMLKVDLDAMQIRIDYHVRQRWDAKGLELPQGLFKPEDEKDVHVTTEEQVLSSVWSPDSFIPNARDTEIHQVASPQSVVSIYRNSTIVFKARMHTFFGCSFAFQWYPLDIQVCDIVFESYKYTSDVVHYAWESHNPVTADPAIQLYQYDVKLPPKLDTGVHKRWGGDAKYPFVKVTFKFERKLGNIVIQIFIPTTLVVILSWFSFWLGLDAVPGRISLLITCMLTLVTMHASLKGSIPPVHYVKMMDVWIVGCMAFVFAAICEFVIVKYMKWRALQREKEKEDREKYIKTHYPNLIPPSPARNQGYPPPPNYSQHNEPSYRRNATNEAVMGGKAPQPSTSAQHRQAWAYASGVPPPPGGLGYPDGFPPYGLSPPVPPRPLWVNIDRVCRVMFPTLFAIFCATYWPILLSGANQQYANI